MTDPTEALTTRLVLVAHADHSIDVQYFIWQNDASGVLVIERLLAAADRGVRVRGLLDDVQLEGFVDRLQALNQHPNVEIRIFNPFSVRLNQRLRLFRLAEFAVDGNRLNHRMHNKLMIADNQLAILGGRNIGDDYFGLSHERNFIDADLLVNGSVVEELSNGFDRYWNSKWARPLDELVTVSFGSTDLDEVKESISARLSEMPEVRDLASTADLSELIAALRQAPDVAEAWVLVDDPEVAWNDQPDEIAESLMALARKVEREVIVVSPYLVPTRNMMVIAAELAGRGIRMRVVTNSLASNDVVIAHSAYASFRPVLLENGVELYEFRGDPAMAFNDRADQVSLHSKYILFDDELVFLGSLNLDPRSLYLNTELGVVLRSRALSRVLRDQFDEYTHPDNAWRVLATEDGLRWASSAGTVSKQPAKSDWQRLQGELMKWLPVSNQL